MVAGWHIFHSTSLSKLSATLVLNKLLKFAICSYSHVIRVCCLSPYLLSKSTKPSVHYQRCKLYELLHMTYTISKLRKNLWYVCSTALSWTGRKPCNWSLFASCRGRVVSSMWRERILCSVPTSLLSPTEYLSLCKISVSTLHSVESCMHPTPYDFLFITVCAFKGLVKL